MAKLSNSQTTTLVYCAVASCFETHPSPASGDNEESKESYFHVSTLNPEKFGYPEYRMTSTPLQERSVELSPYLGFDREKPSPHHQLCTQDSAIEKITWMTE